LWSPSNFSIALPCLISLGHSSAMIIIGQDVFFQFMKKFFNCWSWSQTFNQWFDRRFVIGLWDLGSLLHESSHEVPQWLSVFLLAVVQIWWLSCCVMEHLKCLHEFCLEVYPATDWMRSHQRIPIQDWSFASNDEGIGQCNIVSSC
jgi:hypothetical protein